MRQIKQWLLAVTLITAVTIGIGQNASADMVAGVSLNAQAIVNAFNGMNDGKGMYFDFSPHGSGGNYKITSVHDTPFADTSAYSAAHGGEDFFRSFTVAPTAPAYRPVFGTLNYNSTTGTSSTYGWVDEYGGAADINTLSVGAAYLYKLYATENGMMPQDFVKLGAAIRFFFGDTADYDRGYLGNLLNDPYDWAGVTDNPFLQMLLELNGDMNYWMSDYNPDAYYTEIGNYSVFVMNSGKEWIGPLYGIDFLYVVGAANPHDSATTPEPAMLLLWALGTLGIMGTSYVHRRSRLKKKLELSA